MEPTKIKRRVYGQEFKVEVLRHNMTPFSPGCKRKGVSLYRRLGVDLGTED